jgi:hypothetical protein
MIVVSISVVPVLILGQDSSLSERAFPALEHHGKADQTCVLMPQFGGVC